MCHSTIIAFPTGHLDGLQRSAVFHAAAYLRSGSLPETPPTLPLRGRNGGSSRFNQRNVDSCLTLRKGRPNSEGEGRSSHESESVIMPVLPSGVSLSLPFPR